MPEGDTQEKPGTRFEYDFLAFVDHKKPVYVSTIRRIHHAHDADVPADKRDEVIKSVEYSDGFGRLLQNRAQAEEMIFGDTPFGDAGLSSDQNVASQDAVGRQAGKDHVVVSGWKLYNNKGLVVEQFEPYFDCGWEYKPPDENQYGQKTALFYDPRGQAIRTLNPDGSEQRVIYGFPHDLADPEQFTPSPWEVYTYDENDNAGRTHADKAINYEHHWNTPGSVVLDGLGRAIQTTERNGIDPGKWYTTRSVYDIRGNVLTVVDQLNRESFQYVYDLTPETKITKRMKDPTYGAFGTSMQAPGESCLTQ